MLNMRPTSTDSNLCPSDECRNTCCDDMYCVTPRDSSFTCSKLPDDSSIRSQTDTASTWFLYSEVKPIDHKILENKNYFPNKKDETGNSLCDTEKELRDEIKFLNHRLQLADRRYQAALLLASKTTELQQALAMTMNNKHGVTEETVQLLSNIQEANRIISEEVLNDNKARSLNGLSVPEKFGNSADKENTNKLLKSDESTCQALQLKDGLSVLITEDNQNQGCFKEIKETVVNRKNDDETEINLLRSDKRYLLQKIAFLRHRLTDTEEKLATEQKAMIKLEFDLRTGQEAMRLENKQITENMERILAKQTEMRRLQSENDKIVQDHSEENHLIREKLRTACCQNDELSAALARKTDEVDDLKRQLASLRPQVPVEVRSCCQNAQVEDRLVRAAFDLEAAEFARRDALLQVEKLSSQLDVAKEAYYKLQTELQLTKKSQEAALEDYRQKLATYTGMENELSAAVEQHAHSKFSYLTQSEWREHAVFRSLEHFYRSVDMPRGCLLLPTLASQRLEHSQRLAGEVRQLRDECRQLKEERDQGLKAVVDAQEAAEKANRLLDFMSQPTDCVARLLGQREIELKQCRKELLCTRQEMAKTTKELDKLCEERNALAADLERLLTRRKSLSVWRTEILQLLTENLHINNNATILRPERTDDPHLLQRTPKCIERRRMGCMTVKPSIFDLVRT